MLFESSVICEYLEDTQPGPKLHPIDPLQRAAHRAWIEYASSTLGDVWSLETTRDASVFETKRQAIADKFVRLESALDDGPFFDGDRFSLVDAAFAPVFRYFDTFERLADLKVFDAVPRVRAWRAALAERPSVQVAVEADYSQRLLDFLRRHDAHLLTDRV